MRTQPFTNNEYYHVYNRGVDKRMIFSRPSEYFRFLRTVRRIYDTGSATERPRKIQSLALHGMKRGLRHAVDIVCYCLMTNHYHFLFYQKVNGGISELMHKIDTSYTKYFNLNHHRTGRLFEYTFKAQHVNSDEGLVHVSRYIHLNPLVGGKCTQLKNYSWSSFPDYCGIRNGTLVEKDHILAFFQGKPDAYSQFVFDNAAYAQQLKYQQEHPNDEDYYSLGASQ